MNNNNIKWRQRNVLVDLCFHQCVIVNVNQVVRGVDKIIFPPKVKTKTKTAYFLTYSNYILMCINDNLDNSGLEHKNSNSKLVKPNSKSHFIDCVFYYRCWLIRTLYEKSHKKLRLFFITRWAKHYTISKTGVRAVARIQNVLITYVIYHMCRFIYICAGLHWYLVDLIRTIPILLYAIWRFHWHIRITK